MYFGTSHTIHYVGAVNHFHVVNFVDAVKCDTSIIKLQKDRPNYTEVSLCHELNFNHLEWTKAIGIGLLTVHFQLLFTPVDFMTSCSIELITHKSVNSATIVLWNKQFEEDLEHSARTLCNVLHYSLVYLTW